MSVPNIFQTMCVYLDTSQMKYIIYRPYWYTDQKEKIKKLLRVATSLSININNKDTFNKYNSFSGFILRPKNT